MGQVKNEGVEKWERRDAKRKPRMPLHGASLKKLLEALKNAAANHL